MKLIISPEESRRLTELVIGTPGQITTRILEDGSTETGPLTAEVLAEIRVSKLVTDGLLERAFGKVVIEVEVAR